MVPILSTYTKERVEEAIQAYWLSPFCSGVIELGETLLSWALEAQMLASKAYADAYQPEHQIAYQIKTGLPTSPVTFARLTTASQFQLVNSSKQSDLDKLGYELLDWVRHRIMEPIESLNTKEVRVARLIYTKDGTFTYYERLVSPDLYQPKDYVWRWSEKGNALEGYKGDQKWFSWYPQGRDGTRNQNQLHDHGENILIPSSGTSSRHDFSLGPPSQIDFEHFFNAIQPLIENLKD